MSPVNAGHPAGINNLHYPVTPIDQAFYHMVFVSGAVADFRNLTSSIALCTRDRRILWGLASVAAGFRIVSHKAILAGGGGIGGRRRG